MKAIFVQRAAGLLALCAITGAALANGKAPVKKETQSPLFEQMKKLAGDWVIKDEAGKETVALRYKVTAAGSAVEETIFPGAGHEMVTVYTMDGDKLVLTHYCAIGNQPRFAASTASTSKKLVFECTGVGGAKSHSEMHMHKGTLTLTDATHMTSEWSSFPEGKDSHKVKFEVTKKAAK
jgi:hypothetical protein